jgi:inner membrane protein
MDNLTHSLVGAALAEVGPRDRWALATPTLIVAANVPDVDVLSYLVAGEFAALAWRRGITHGVPALLLWPFLVAALMLGWDRWVRRRRDPAATPARFGPLLGLAAIGALTHPALDWLNTYGMRWWLPFDGGWSYGDSVFIIDPWLWLGLGGVVFLARSATRKALITWGAVAALASVLVLGIGMVPVGAKVVWVGGVLMFAVARWLRPFGSDAGRRRTARIAVAGAGAYVVAMIGVAALAERDARATALGMGLDALDVMTGPRPARLMARDVVVRTTDDYRSGSWRWGRSPRLELDQAVPMRRGPDAVIDAALADPRAQHYLTWSRYPYVHATAADDGWRVWIGDVRYPGRGLGGLEVLVPGSGSDPVPRAPPAGTPR